MKAHTANSVYSKHHIHEKLLKALTINSIFMKLTQPTVLAANIIFMKDHLKHLQYTTPSQKLIQLIVLNESIIFMKAHTTDSAHSKYHVHENSLKALAVQANSVNSKQLTQSMYNTQLLHESSHS